MWDETTSERITVEIALIDRLFTTYADLLAQAQQREPDLVERTALASVLHSFYNGIEAIGLMVAKTIDHEVPGGARWHRDLLRRMGQATSTRPPLLSEATVTSLEAYLSFRHFYRHAYSFLVEWEKMEPLVLPLETVWAQARADLVAFLESPTTPDESESDP